ncbi:hypothetical protein J6590_064636 [Homalodisca vitripennis]|nr:hypothetical protein J6590_064636 [Homalodisca vitripennis]
MYFYRELYDKLTPKIHIICLFIAGHYGGVQTYYMCDRLHANIVQVYKIISVMRCPVDIRKNHTDKKFVYLQKDKRNCPWLLGDGLQRCSVKSLVERYVPS